MQMGGQEMELHYNIAVYWGLTTERGLMISHRIWRHMFIYEIRVPIQSLFLVRIEQKNIMDKE